MLLEFVGDVNGMKAEELLLQLRTTTVGFLGQSLLYHKLHTYIHITYIYICIYIHIYRLARHILAYEGCGVEGGGGKGGGEE